jgi:hypothetical protein
MNTCGLKAKVKRESLAKWQNQWEQSTSQMLNIKRTTEELNYPDHIRNNKCILLTERVKIRKKIFHFT